MPAKRKPSYFFDKTTGDFVVKEYDAARPFSNFLPGISGLWGVPMWVYYVNRAQCAASAGIKDKDGQILEFHSFNKACARVADEGFRTFIKIDGKTLFEPFAPAERRLTNEAGRPLSVKQKYSREMRITPHQLVIKETAGDVGLEITAAYFTLADMPTAGLARILEIKNTSRRAQRIEWLDGAARVLPYGLDRQAIKFIPRHIEAMMGVAAAGKAVIFRLKQTADDTEEVAKIQGGHFYAAAPDRGSAEIIYDPETVFGEAFEYRTPHKFADGGLKALSSSTQRGDNKTPCAFAAGQSRLRAGGHMRVVSVLGYASADKDAARIAGQIGKKDFIVKAGAANKRRIDAICDLSFTASSEPVFDAYARQNFLDNVIRGGMPVTFETKEGPSAFYAFSRQNGDLERDYHYFVVEPTYLSQGNGHYRSVLQNRRQDVWFFPETAGANLKIFMGLIQLDGYNPLEVKCLYYRLSDKSGFARAINKIFKTARAVNEITTLASKPFSPGALVMAAERMEPRSVGKDRMAFIGRLLKYCVEDEIGGLHEGFWADHWHYNFDLLESYRAVYPDKIREMLGDNTYTYFDDPDVIVPRDKKTFMRPDGKIRRYGAVERDAEKLSVIKSRDSMPYRVRDKFGRGKIYRTTLAAKIMCVIVNRLAALDPDGLGVDKEAGKPGWNDSMNGLPALFGSGLSESLELLRALKLTQELVGDAAKNGNFEIALHNELADFTRELEKLITAKNAGRINTLHYWDASNDLKEKYRRITKLGVGGREESFSAGEIQKFLAQAHKMLETNLTGKNSKGRSVSPQGVPYTYLTYEAKKYKTTGRPDSRGLVPVKAETFARKPVKLFLEGAVHRMKALPGEAPAIYRAVKKSRLFDDKLKMYKSCEPMKGENPELGRAVGAYPPGWIENESVYLHMEFKYLLEILRAGLADEFWRNAETTLMPFLDPAVYGRSTIEGASFIVSSAYADPKYHGMAFQPRLSGITCEFINIWTLATAGARPFILDGNGRLELRLEPRLPARLFTRGPVTRRYNDPDGTPKEITIAKNSFAFRLFGGPIVIYENPARKNTYGAGGARTSEWKLLFKNGGVGRYRGAALHQEAAIAVRRNLVEKIIVTLS